MRVNCSHICKSFATQHILQDFSCDISSGSSYALLGPSGSGKSTLLNICAGLDIPDSGSVTHDDTLISSQKTAWRERWRIAHIGMLRQDPLLDHKLSALENILVPAIFQRIPDATTQALALLDAFGLSTQAQQACSTLSGGQHMRVALARALMGAPKILIVDEPTGTLDQETAAALGNTLQQASHQHGFTLIIATHDLNLAAHCDQRFEFKTAPSIQDQRQAQP